MHNFVERASTPPESKSISRQFRLFYRHSETSIDPGYLNNTLQMDTIVRYLARSPKIDSITVYAYASPEGSWRGNKRLAIRRAEVAKEFILSHLAPGTRVPKIILNPVPEHWEGLYEEVKANYHLWDRNKVLGILEDNSVGFETKKWRLQQLNDKRTWYHLIGRHMPELRVATWICIWEAPHDIEPCRSIIAPLPAAPDKGLAAMGPRPEHRPARPVASSIIVTVPGDSALNLAGLPEPVRDSMKKRSYIPALKTNLLYDVTTTLNASAEFPIGERFSVMVEDIFPWWSWGPNDRKYCYQLWEMGVEPRWWFKSDGNLKGHFAGIYGKSGRYDFQNDTRLCYQGEYWSAGVSYGYAMKIGRLLQMEFSVSVGFMQAGYRHYQPDYAYEHLFRDKYKTGTISYFGPTKIAVTLVLPIRFGAKNEQ